MHSPFRHSSSTVRKAAVILSALLLLMIVSASAAIAQGIHSGAIVTIVNEQVVKPVKNTYEAYQIMQEERRHDEQRRKEAKRYVEQLKQEINSKQKNGTQVKSEQRVIIHPSGEQPSSSQPQYQPPKINERSSQDAQQSIEDFERNIDSKKTDLEAEAARKYQESVEASRQKMLEAEEDSKQRLEEFKQESAEKIEAFKEEHEIE